jgi:hypothetical protein
VLKTLRGLLSWVTVSLGRVSLVAVGCCEVACLWSQAVEHQRLQDLLVDIEFWLTCVLQAVH